MSKVRGGQVFVEIGANASKLFAALGSINKQIGQVGRSMAALGAGMTAAGSAIVAPLAGAATAFASVGDAVQKMAIRTGMSAEAVSGLAYAAQQSGADAATLEKGIRTMQRTMDDAATSGGSTAEAFRRLGVDVAALRGMSPERQFLALADAMGQMADPGQRAALAMDVFGKAGTSLLPMFADGVAGIELLRNEAERLGLVMSRETADSAAALGDATSAMGRAMQAVAVNVGGAVAPILTKLANTVAAATGQFARFVKENSGVIQAALAVGAAIAGVGAALAAGGVAVMTMSAGLGAIGTVLAALASPIAIVAAGIAGLVAFGPQIKQGLTAAFGGLGATVGNAANAIAGPLRAAAAEAAVVLNEMGATAYQTFNGIIDAVTSGDIQGAFSILWTGIELVTLQGIQAFDSAFHPFIDAILGGFDWLSTEAAKAWQNLFVTLATNTWGQYLLGAIDNIINSVVASFDFLVGSIQKSWAIITGLFDSGANVQAEIDRIDQENQRRADERGQQRPGMAGRVGISEQQKEEIRRQAAATNAGLDAARDARSQDRLGRRDRRQEQIDQARAKLNDLTAKASTAADTVRETLKAEAAMRAGSMLDPAAIASQAGQSASEVVGTFSGAALGQMGFGANLAQKQLDELKQIRQGIDRLEPAGVTD